MTAAANKKWAEQWHISWQSYFWIQPSKTNSTGKLVLLYCTNDVRYSIAAPYTEGLCLESWSYSTVHHAAAGTLCIAQWEFGGLFWMKDLLLSLCLSLHKCTRKRANYCKISNHWLCSKVLRRRKVLMLNTDLTFWSVPSPVNAQSAVSVVICSISAPYLWAGACKERRLSACIATHFLSPGASRPHDEWCHCGRTYGGGHTYFYTPAQLFAQFMDLMWRYVLGPLEVRGQDYHQFANHNSTLLDTGSRHPV